MRSSGSGAKRTGSISRTSARLSRGTGTALDALLAVLLAPVCPVCQTLLDHPMRGPVCPACWDTVPLLTPPLCDRCGDPLPSWRVISQHHARCPRCRRGRSALDRARTISPYAGTLRRIVHLFKYQRHQTLAAPLGALMRRGAADFLADADFVVPVPLHPRRRRERGFNQAAELAVHLGPPVVEALRRTIATRPQIELPAARRHRNVRGAFAPARWTVTGGTELRWLRHACVVLVDDVTTTGATLEACAGVLRRCGVREVRGLTLARAARRQSP
jgi:ComF family protein